MTTSEQPTTSTLPTIDELALDEVTGGCAACGQNCANGPAPAGGKQQQLDPFAGGNQRR